MSKPRVLTDRQRRFVDLYVRPEGEDGGDNATRAAGEAGYAWPAKQGPRLLTFPAVGDAIWERFSLLHPEAAAMLPRDWGERSSRAKKWVGRPGCM